MKNEPVVTYNHMDEDLPMDLTDGNDKKIPVSLYMILAIDLVLLALLGFAAVKILF